MTLKMTSAQVVETSVIVNNNSSFQNYTNPDDHTQQTTDTPGFKPFTVLQEKINHNQSFSEFSETEATNLKKLASFFQDAIHFHPRHLQPKTLIFTIRAPVE